MINMVCTQHPKFNEYLYWMQWSSCASFREGLYLLLSLCNILILELYFDVRYSP